ncbi:MAG: TetR/AcrR family transcriptional regulator [Thermotogota bacterium]
MPRNVDREARRAELVSAATTLFARRGVANTAVSDIVKAAGVAQGTFYLYFASKDDALLAVVERIGSTMMDEVAARVGAGSSAIEKMHILGNVLSNLAAQPDALDIITLMHLPENRALHDRLAEDLTPRLIPLVEAIIEQGVAEGVFRVSDARAAAWFVLGGLQSVELAGTAPADMPPALARATEFALRALGCQGPRP